MFSENERMKIWNICEHHAGVTEEQATDNSYIPSLEELRRLAMNALRDEGFLVESSERCDANCIIRVYRHTGMSLPGQDRATWMYGFEAYVQNMGCFRCEPVGKKFDYINQAVNLYGNRGRRTKVQLYKPSFEDYFVKVQ